MQRQNLFWLASSLSFSVLAACGGGVDIDKIRTDFDNPSGSVAEKESVIAVNEKRSATGDEAFGIASVANPFGSGFGLTAELPRSAALNRNVLSRLEARRLLAPTLRKIGSLATGQRQFNLGMEGEASSSDDFSNCVDQQELMSQVDVSSFSAGGGSGSFSVSMDLSSCTQIMTGTIDIDASFDISQTNMHMEMEQRFNEVCEKVTDRAQCLSGSMVLEMDGNLSGGSMSIMQGWDLELNWKENGKAMSAASRGGLRISGSESGDGSIELLFYVRNKAGEEVSFVLKVSGSADGSGTLEIRGKDGSLSCSVDAEGAGSCSGSFDLEWDAQEAGVIRSSDDFRFYD